ncbi:hypothetical protein FQN54_002039 [Arachnomyces sp. PD_36]|nr:hypothetical protein FQN54_002039 [Arachnomyces sp. PD_36]
MSFEKALAAIDHAHSLDPTLVTPPSSSSSSSSSSSPIPYEQHYANKMTHYLNLHTPSASPTLRLAVRAQHLRRWEVPRDTYPATRVGYLSWRTFLKNRQGDMVEKLCVEEGGYTAEEAREVGKLVRKEGLVSSSSVGSGVEGEEERDVQILEDVACLVFLDDQFEKFEREKDDEEKILRILKKTWGKMSGRGRELALKIEMSERARGLVEKAVSS